ncbi:DNA polymerase III subunit delta [Buchnera aphidicola (Thelaxes californica)]|uniref:DNA polymerase III subunit delta n=1 Tax=Buchnera aphidicola (Thelaxes californica) TaxID=1315998 RepID=A0A4D6YP33_9GAMM|nr:DNA polymerase III subunit delta [Buchnera aphidicola]QCI26865.1 DNA polymerase III subunit delta [Buchnera aphidicola (Thelaxes californica)]
MKCIFYEELENYYIEKKNVFCYFIIGNDTLLLQDSINFIVNTINKNKFFKKFEISIQKKQDYQLILKILQINDFFNQNKILFISFKSNCFDKKILKKIENIFPYLNEKVILITFFTKIDIKIKKIWSQYSKYKNIITIYCNTLNQKKILVWFNNKEKYNNVTFTQEAKEFLCNHFDNNFLFLRKEIEIILLLYQKKKNISLNDLKKNTTFNSQFTVFQWIDCLFLGNKKKSLKILNVLHQSKIHPLNIIRMLQKDIIILIEMQQQKNVNSTFLFQKTIWKSRHHLFFRLIKNNKINIFYKIIKILYIAEISEKKNNQYYTWIILQSIIYYIK